MRGPRLGVLLAALLLLPAPALAQDAGGQADPALAPLQVALRDLPAIIDLALNESEERLLSDVAQGRLAEELEYVRGFSELPPAGGALRDADVRSAYAWLEEVVEVASGVPATFDDSQRAGATCHANFAGVPASDPEATVALGRDALDRLEVLRAELQRLLEESPSVIDATPLAQAVLSIDSFWVTVVPGIRDCLERLAQEAAAGGIPATPVKLVLLPATSFPTGHVRVLGSAPAGSTVRVTAPSLGLDASPGLVRGSFKLALTVPRGAALGNHTVTATDGDAAGSAVLRVAKAPVTLLLQAPSAVLLDSEFTVRVAVASPAALADLDAVPVHVSWRSEDRPLALHNTTSGATLQAGGLGSFVLSADYAGSAILSAAHTEIRIDVVAVAPASQPGSPATQRAFSTPEGIDWFWWILAGVLAVLFALALYYSPVLLHQVRGHRSSVVRGTRPPPRWPGADSLAAAVAALFALLRRVGLVPPGRTVQEWVRSTKGPQSIADQFDAVRYGGAVESDETRREGASWAKAAWERWKP